MLIAIMAWKVIITNGDKPPEIYEFEYRNHAEELINNKTNGGKWEKFHDKHNNIIRWTCDERCWNGFKLGKDIDDLDEVGYFEHPKRLWTITLQRIKSSNEFSPY
jgi:hypothetical protein